MSLSSALGASVSGLNANATKISTTSDNIANSNTIGYKKVGTEFSALVMSSNVKGAYSAGGVETTIKRSVEQQGLLKNTGNNLDIAVDGGGFFPVTTVADADNYTAGSDPVRLAVTGSFEEDNDGFLVSKATGQFLLGWPVDATGTASSVSYTSFTDLEPINTSYMQYTVQPTSYIKFSGNLPQEYTNSVLTPTVETVDYNVEYVNKLGGSQTLDLQFTPQQSATGTNTWDLTVTDNASTPAAVIGDIEIVFEDGKIQTSGVTATTGTYDEATGFVTVTTADGASLQLYIGKPQQQEIGFTQFLETDATDEKEGITVEEKDGATLSKLLDTSIDEGGMVYAVFENGIYVPIYQIPIVTVENPNALQAVGGQAYALTAEAGTFRLNTAGQNSIAKLSSGALMQSTVDIAEELTSLIETQRAYSSNAKVIQTVDEMFQETTNIKR